MSKIGIALVVVGLLVRLALYFPPALFTGDSDAVLSGLCAFRVAEGQYPVFFPGGTRLSAASCYVAAGYFHFFGPGRVGLALTGLTWGALYLIFSLLFLQAILGRKSACVAFLFAIIPSEQFMTVTYVPWGYGEIVASCAATLWLAALWRKTGAPWQPVLFGLSVGLGIYFSFETLMVALPAIAWIALGRRSAVRREWLAALAGAVVGAMLFLAWNATHGFASLTQNWASRPASGIAQAGENFAWLATHALPQLFFGSARWPETVLVVAYAIVALAFIIAMYRNANGSDYVYAPRQIGVLLLLILIASVSIFSFSQAGSIRGWTVRYIAPLYLAVPPFCAIGIQAMWRWSRALCAATVAAVLIPNLVGYSLPGSSSRNELTADLSDYNRVRQVLARHHIQMVYGDYFLVYHLNFDSGERIAGVPSAPVVDYYDYGDRLGASSVRWALLGDGDQLQQLVQTLRAHGTLIPAGDHLLFVANRAAPNAAELIATLRRSGT
ncbi:MAG: hypothetical protein JO113_05450 [Candidatus Eremiobacteraeota bacterium]|nr:hypothetical protein [Candidatus Eremiobacteraeota bacterium]